ncbi:MAG: NAD(P)H-dependent oxidoreductase [Thermotogota bacterium]|nr:NAD(P)H-dependent oxidoreductase [Thermotogota bacterium]
MTLLAINGSPRGRVSNTKKLIEYFTKDITHSTVNVLHLKEYYDQDDLQSAISTIKDHKYILIGFPLYADWTPGFVKEFLEQMGECQEVFTNKHFLFMVQCGFPESHHCRYVERYCERFTKRIGANYIGTIVRGGSEGARIIPKKFFKDAQRLAELGKLFENEKNLDQPLLKAIAKPEKLSKVRLFLVKISLKFPISNLYWNSQLKKNGVYDHRFDKPYR